MIELLTTHDPVRLSYLRWRLAEAGIETEVFDAGSPWPGAFPSRLMVAQDDHARAEQIVAEAERG